MSIKYRYQRKKLCFSIRRECAVDDALLGKTYILDVWGLMQEVNWISNRTDQRVRFYWYRMLDFFESDEVFSDCGVFPLVNIPVPTGLSEWTKPVPVHENMSVPLKKWQKKLPPEG